MFEKLVKCVIYATVRIILCGLSRLKTLRKQLDSLWEHKQQVSVEMYEFFTLWTSVVQWSEFLATDTEVSGSIPGATRFSE